MAEQVHQTPGRAPTDAGRRGRRLTVGEQAQLAYRVTSHETLAETVLGRCRGNLVMATHVLSFIALYGVFVEQNGREPRSVLELALSSRTKSKRSKATVDRWASKFRQAFPEYDMPSVLWASVREQVMGEPSLFVADKLDADVLSLQIGAAQL